MGTTKTRKKKDAVTGGLTTINKAESARDARQWSLQSTPGDDEAARPLSSESEPTTQGVKVPPIVLVLGVTDVTDAQSLKLSRAEPPWRDYSRLRALERAGFRVYSVSNGNEDLAPRATHFRHSFSRRGGKATLRDLLEAGVVVDAIFLDYFRFPSDYMRHAYEHIPPFLQAIVPACATDTKVYVPVLRTAPLFTSWATATRMRAADHPLSRVTSTLDKQTYLGGYSNFDQLSHLRADEPFDALPIPKPGGEAQERL